MTFVAAVTTDWNREKSKKKLDVLPSPI